MSDIKMLIRRIVAEEVARQLLELFSEDEEVSSPEERNSSPRLRKKPSKKILPLHREIAEAYRGGERYNDIQVRLGVSSAVVQFALDNLLTKTERAEIVSRNKSRAASLRMKNSSQE